jgi:serine/threonine protein phosphatase PrpC
LAFNHQEPKFLCPIWCLQGENLVIANVGDSRAVLATTSIDGSLVPLQLTIDFKPNLPGKSIP